MAPGGEVTALAVGLALAGWLWAWPALALAEEAAAAPLPGEDFGAALAKMLLALALVLAFMGGLWWLARRFLPSQAGGGPSGGMRVLGRLPLGPRKGLVLVEVAGRVLVLGLSEQGLNLLTTLDDPREVAGLAAAGKGAFGRALRKAQGGQAQGGSAPGQAGSAEGGPEARP